MLNETEDEALSGSIILGFGIGLVVLSVVLLIVSIVYRNTTGKKIRKKLEEEY